MNFRNLTCALFLGVFFCTPSFSQSSPDGIWRAIDTDEKVIGINQLSSLGSLPESFRPFRLDRSKLNKVLQGSTAALSSATPCKGVIFTLPKPTPENIWLRFCVTEASIMEPRLASQFPSIKTYEGQGIDDPAMTLALDWTPTGFHAMVLGADGSFFIDPLPLRKGDLSTYMSYFDKDAREKPFQCFVQTEAEANKPEELGKSPIPNLSNGTKLRTYRLAVATTGEFTRFHGGSVPNTLGAIVTTIARVNAIYKHELAIQLLLVNDQQKIIYTDPATDPYSNDNAGLLLAQNQTNLDTVIGSANYDIGHVFGTGGGGLASLGVVGKPGLKARGETGSSSPKGDPFDVDYVAHEIGHQFGANHTFNGTTGSCAGTNRNIQTAYEPGSGSTIMAYAGICGDENLQKQSDPFFHVASLHEILLYVSSDDVKNVPTITDTNNAAPSVTSEPSFRIPKQTPFSLVASAADLNGDKLTFGWEQVDLGAQGPPNDDTTAIRPLFRSFRPESNGMRVFPRLTTLLNGGSELGEALPRKDRRMNFTVTARDNRVGGGGIATATTEIIVVSDAGPFRVTQPARTANWIVGSAQTVTWDRAGTDLSPIECKNVRILLSNDGGKSFKVLVDNTPNTGSAQIVVPNTPTTSARLKIEAAGNVFFGLSDSDFRISLN